MNNTQAVSSAMTIENRWRRVVEMTTAMTAAPDGVSLATTIEVIALDTLQASACVFFALDRKTGALLFEAPGRVYFQLRRDEDIRELIAWSDRDVAIIPDIREETWPVLARPSDLSTPRSALVIPVRSTEDVTNLLVAFGQHAEHGFTRDDLELGVALARHAAFAVQHLIHYETAHQAMLGRNALYEVGKRISSSLDLNEVLNLIIDSLQMVVPYDAAVILLLDREKNAVIQQTIRGYDEMGVRRMDLKVGEGISGWAAKTGRAIIVGDVTQDDRYVRLRSETRSEMAVPLLQGDEVIGVFNIESNHPGIYDERDQALLEAFASQATIAIQNARLFEEARRSHQLERELAVAGDIQRALMPRNLPEVKGLSLAVLSEPTAEVGGDFYDLLMFSDKYLGLAVGDVAGKGIPAAITMASLYTAFHEYATDPLMTPSDIMTRVNVMLHEATSPDRFATLFYGVLNLKDGKFRYCNAGHNPPIVSRVNGSATHLSAGGLVLGSFPQATFEMGETVLSEGDILVLYTDGVTEAVNAEHQEFGLQRLEQVIQACPGVSADEIRKCLISTLKGFTGDEMQRDDITVVIMKVESVFQAERVLF